MLTKAAINSSDALPVRKEEDHRLMNIIWNTMSISTANCHDLLPILIISSLLSSSVDLSLLSITISQNIIFFYKQLKDAAVLYFVHIQPLVLLV